MAEEIKLSAGLKDDITPKLQKIERSLAQVTRSFERLGRKLRPINKELGIMAMSTERISKAFRAQSVSMQASMRTMDQYKRSVGQVVNAEQKLGKTIAFTNNQAMAASRQSRMAPSSVVGGGGGRSGALMAGAAAGGVVLGSQLSGMMTQAITRGFMLGSKILMAPFQKLGGMFAERIGDEMSDITSAGGMFAIDKKNSPMNRMFKDFAAAREMQRDLNAALAKSAAALPGETNQYVQAAKMLTDTVMEIAVKDRDNFKGLAKDFGSDGTARDDITKMLTKFTEQSVLLQMGSGRGGMPLGILLEQLVTMDQVNIQSMRRRYSQLRYNPLLANSLEDAAEQINAQGKNTAGRFRAVIDALDKALPKEVVNAMTSSLDGVYQAIKSGFLDPEVGLFGLGRALAGLEFQKFDAFGQKIQGVGVTLSLFETLRDIIAGFGLPLAEIVAVLPTIYDPLAEIGKAFIKLRETAMNMLYAFNRFTRFFDEAGFEDAGVRGAVASFNNLLQTVGAIGDNDAIANAQKLMDGASVGPMLLGMFDQLMNSDFMMSVGEAIGKSIAGVIGIVADLMGFASGASTNKFAAGIRKGFEEAGGIEAFKNFVKDFIGMMFNGLKTIFMNIGLGGQLLVAAALIGPALVTGITTALVAALPGFAAAVASGMKGFFLGIKGGKVQKTPHGTGIQGGGLFGGNLVGDAQADYYQGKNLGFNLRQMFNKATRNPMMPNPYSKGSMPSGVGMNKPYASKPGVEVVDDMLKGGKNAKSLGQQMAEGFGKSTAKAGGIKINLGQSFKMFKVGGLITGVLSSLDRFLTGDIFGGLANTITAGTGSIIGTTLGAALGSIVLPGIGTAIGAAIGGTVGAIIGDLDVFIEPVKGALMGFWDALTSLGAPIGDMLSTLMEFVGVIGDLAGQFWSALTAIFPPLKSLEDTSVLLDAGFIAMKIALTPVTALFDVLAFAFRGLVGQVYAAGGALIGLANLIPGIDIDTTALEAAANANQAAIREQLGRFTTGGSSQIDMLPSGRQFGDPLPGQTVTPPTVTPPTVTPPTVTPPKTPSFAPASTSTDGSRKRFQKKNVAYGFGPGRPAFFSSQKEAMAWEKTVAPSSSSIASVTSNSSEMGGSSTITNNITVNGTSNPQETAELVAQEIMSAIEKSTYNELYMS